MLKFQKVKKGNLEQILKWRTLPEVTRYMNTDIKNDIEDQKKWFKKFSTNKNQKAWIISYESQNIGFSEVLAFISVFITYLIFLPQKIPDLPFTLFLTVYF